MHNFKKVQQNYVELKNDYETKTESAEKKIARLERKIAKLKNNYPHWTDDLLLPILKLIAEKTPDLVWDFEEDKTLSTFGLRAECPVFASDDRGKLMASICFTPGDLDKGILRYDTGEEKDGYQQGTLGNLNGFNNKTKEVESIDELVEFVNKKVELAEQEDFEFVYYETDENFENRNFSNVRGSARTELTDAINDAKRELKNNNYVAVIKVQSLDREQIEIIRK